MWNIKKIIKKGDYLYALVPEHPKCTKKWICSNAQNNNGKPFEQGS